jgi:hypothetical protein
MWPRKLRRHSLPDKRKEHTVPAEGMPKHLAKGRMLMAFEQRYQTAALAALANLRNSGSTTEIASVLQLIYPNWNVPGPDQIAYNAARQHFYDHWLGRSDPPLKRTTGWWHAYKGDPEAVLREGLSRAIEVSLGLPHGVPLPLPAGTQPRSPALPIEMFWICGLPKFEVYINWNQRQVDVIVLTPGFSDPSLTPAQQQMIQVRDFPDESGLNAVVNAHQRQRGLILVGQNVNPGSKVVARMQPGVVVNNMDLAKGGV